MPTVSRLAPRLLAAVLALATTTLAAQTPTAAPSGPRRPGAQLTTPASSPTPLAPSPLTPAPRLPSDTSVAPTVDSPAAPTDAPASAEAATNISREDLAAFVDGVVRSYIDQKGVAGVTVAIVDRNGDLLVRGYGDASLDPARAVDPAETLFRLGSTSKTFTYVAAMQLVGAGQLKLDAEVNQYLPDTLKLPDAGFEPVRVWHLMTHTAGFEDSALGHLFNRSPDHVPALEAYLARYRPKRVRAPGVHAVYSNYSVGLLGAIVARVSGEPFERYLDAHVFAPAGMRHTTVREPLATGDPRRVDAAFDAAWSTGFERSAGGYAARSFEFVSSLAPAGAGSSTAADMARWMRMLLNSGVIDGQTVLAPAAFAELSTINFRNAADVGAIAHGFFRARYGRYESLEHGGDTLWFHTNLVVLPEAGLGVFISTNTDTGGDLTQQLPRLVFERFLPDARPAPPPLPAKDFATTGQRFVRVYMSERRNYSTLEKIFSGLTSTTAVSIDNDGHLLVAGDPPRRYVQESELGFRAIEGNARLDFLADADGRIVGMASPYGHSISDRIRWYDGGQTLGLVAGFVAIASLLIVLGAWHRRRLPARLGARDGRLSTGWLTLTAFAWIGFFVLAGIAVGEVASGNDIVFVYPTTMLRIAIAAAYVVATLSAIAALLLPPVLSARDWGFGRKLRHVFAVVLMLALVALFVRWNVLFAPLGIGA